MTATRRLVAILAVDKALRLFGDSGRGVHPSRRADAVIEWVTFWCGA
jgi:hypothetical protein